MNWIVTQKLLPSSGPCNIRYWVVSAPPSSALVTAMHPNNKRYLQFYSTPSKVTAFGLLILTRENTIQLKIPFMMSGPMVDSMILSMADPRSEEVEAVESETIMAPSDTALEWTKTWADSDTSTDWVTVDTLDTLVDWATEDESGRWTDETRTSVLELVSGINTLTGKDSMVWSSKV